MAHRSLPDYSSSFNRMTGFRHTAHGITPGTVKGTSGHSGGKRSPTHPVKPGGKKPTHSTVR